ncbi:MAG: class I SAM-dependent methyltransferase [Nocardioidaceae bacterium]
MNLGYQIAYRVGFTPWDRKSPASLQQIAQLLDREQQQRTPPLGKALDIGCGTGTHTVDLARRGWEVTGIDAVGTALAKARDRVAVTGVDATLLHGDVTSLSRLVGGGFGLALDLGCFHGLAPQQRSSYARELTHVTEPDATLLMFAFSPGRRGPMPRGVDREEVEDTFAGWRVSYEEKAEIGDAKGPAASADPRWFRLTRLSDR